MSVKSIAPGLPMLEPHNPFEPVGKKELDRSDFMTLFITQLQYQDPMKPMESYEMASQLAQFSGMEATMKMSDSIDELLDYQKSQNNLQILGLLGSEVEVDGNVVSVENGKVGKAAFELPVDVEFCQVDIFDEAGRLVRSLDRGAVDSGSHTLEWDGTNGLDDNAENGKYAFQVTGLDYLGDRVDVGYKSMGKVTEISFDGDQAMVTLENQVTIPVGSVVRVGAPVGEE